MIEHEIDKRSHKLKIGIKCFSRFLLVAHGRKPFKSSFSRTNQTANKRGGQKKCVKIFLNLTYLYKTQPGQKTAGNFPNFFEDIYSLDVWVSRFGCRCKYLMVSRSYGASKPMRHSTLNNRNSGLETMAITIVIFLITIPERQMFTFPIVLAIVFTPQFLWFKIQCPFDFYVN